MTSRQTLRTAALAARVYALPQAQGRSRPLSGSPAANESIGSEADDLEHWRRQRLDAAYAMVFFDSLAVKVRDRNLLSAKRLHLALGVLDDGTKDIIGAWILDPHDNRFWSDVATELRARGVRRIGLVSAEDDAALPAIGEAFPSARLFRNLRCLLQSAVKRLPAAVRATARVSFLRFVDDAGSTATLADLNAHDAVMRLPAFADFWSRHWDLAAPVLALPAALRGVLIANSAVESITEKLRRRGITKRSTFASAEAAIRELVFILQDAKASWKVSPQKWRMACWEIQAEPEAPPDHVTDYRRL